MSDEVLSTVKLLIDECNEDNPDINKIDEYIIRCCNNKEDINRLFPINLEASRHGTFYLELTPLHVTCMKGHHEIVSKLLANSNNYKFPIDINAISEPCDATPLLYACEHDSQLTVQALLKHPDIEVNGGSYLHIACALGKKEIVMELLKHSSIQLTEKDHYGKIPLHTACRRNSDTDIIQILLSHQKKQHLIVQLNAADEYGTTPLHCACDNTRYGKVVPLLLEHATVMDINATDNYC